MIGRWHIRWVAALATLVSALAGSVAVGGAEVPAPVGCPPVSFSPTPVPDTGKPTATVPPAAGAILVCVGSRPITGAQFAHWLAIARKGESTSKQQMSFAEMSSEVLGFLISARWEADEAARLRIHVTPAQVQRAFVRIRDQQFPKHREFEAFLRSSGESIADLEFRVKLNLLSQRTIKRVEAGRGGAAKQQRALARFVHDFFSRWHTRTSCAAEYVVRDCGRVQGTP